MSDRIEPLSEESKAALRAIDSDWPYNACCGEGGGYGCGGCYVDALTGA